MHGLNFRLNEFTAALGIVQVDRLDEIVAWKNEVARTQLDALHPSRLQLPDGMTSGLYKYIVFEPIEQSTGKVYDEPCHRILGHAVDLPNTDWVAENHWCVPALLPPARSGEGPRHRRLRVHRLARRRQAARRGPRAADPRPDPLALSRADVRDGARRPVRSRDRARRALAGCDAVHAPRGGRRRRPGREGPDAHRSGEHAAARRCCSRPRAQPGVKRFVYASTIWVYGDAAGPEAVDEDTPLGLPKHFYTATKIAGEMYTASYGELYDLEWTILRFGIPYGPRARPTAVVPAFTAKALAGQPLTIAGDGTQSRRFVYVEDLAEGVVAALVPAAANRVYNLVGRENTSVRAIARAVRDVVGDVPIVHVEGRAGDLRGGNISGERAARRARLGADAPPSPTACAATSSG